MAKRRRGNRRPAGEFPGEYLRRSLVAVERLAKPGDPGMTTFDHYIVQTQRRDGEWRATVEFKGETYVLPGKVLLQLQRHQDSIGKAARHDKAVETAETLTRQARAREVQHEPHSG